MLQTHAVTYGTDHFEPVDSAESDTSSKVRLPAFFWVRERSGAIHSVSLEEATAMVKPTLYFPWTWIGIIASRQVLPLRDFLLADNPRLLERIDDTSLDRWNEMCDCDRAEQFAAYAG